MRRSQRIAAAVALRDAGPEGAGRRRAARSSRRCSPICRHAESSSRRTSSSRSTARRCARRRTSRGRCAARRSACRSASRFGAARSRRWSTSRPSPRRPVRAVPSSASSSSRRPTSDFRSTSRSTRRASAGLPPGSRSPSTCCEELGRNVDGGHKIAATGELFLNGAVGPDRRRQAKDDRRTPRGCGRLPRAGGDNAREARKYAHGLRIIPVKSFQQALRALATLPDSA